MGGELLRQRWGRRRIEIRIEWEDGGKRGWIYCGFRDLREWGRRDLGDMRFPAWSLEDQMEGLKI